MLLLSPSVASPCSSTSSSSSSLTEFRLERLVWLSAVSGLGWWSSLAGSVGGELLLELAEWYEVLELEVLSPRFLLLEQVRKSGEPELSSSALGASPALPGEDGASTCVARGTGPHVLFPGGGAGGLGIDLRATPDDQPLLLSPALTHPDPLLPVTFPVIINK